jgi:hypothetical protein
VHHFSNPKTQPPYHHTRKNHKLQYTPKLTINFTTVYSTIKFSISSTQHQNAKLNNHISLKIKTINTPTIHYPLKLIRNNTITYKTKRGDQGFYLLESLFKVLPSSLSLSYKRRSGGKIIFPSPEFFKRLMHV